MGIVATVYRAASLERNGIDCTNDGISSRADNLVIVNAHGPFGLTPDGMHPGHLPAWMESHTPGCLRIVPAHWDPEKGWLPTRLGFMMGGNYAATSDSRFAELAERLLGHRFYGAVAIHDRLE